MTDADLPRITEDQFRADPQKYILLGRNGTQTAIIDAQGRIRTIIGNSNERIFADRPNPLEGLEL